MKTVIENEYIICGRCMLKFERDKQHKHCSNCFACTGCEIYYCPGCDNEIVITPVKQISRKSKKRKANKGESQKKSSKKEIG